MPKSPSNNRPTLVKVGRRKLIHFARRLTPNYLRGLCEAHGINRANVTVVPGDGETNAARLVQKARRRFDTDRDFDAVFVICDCAGEDLADAQTLAGRSLRNVTGQPVTIEMIVSRPSFEFWLLLHFEYASRPFPQQLPSSTFSNAISLTTTKQIA
jgi:RloB-like protein